MLIRRKSRSLNVLFAAAVLLGVMFTSSTTWAQSNTTPISSRSISAAEAKQVTAYWTNERMLNATPMQMITPPKAVATAAPTFGPTRGPVVLADSGNPGDTPKELRLASAADTPEPTFGAYPFSYTRYRLFPDRNDLALYKAFPYRTVGKLYFTIPGSGNYVCSASVVNSDNKSVVWTAGHCVYSQGIGFHTNFLFAPGRFLTANPYGTWTALTAFTLGGWTNGLLEYDHGALVMNRGGLSGTSLIGDAVGWLGFAANVNRQQHWHDSGYPAGARDLATTPPGAQFDGLHHEICAAPWASNDQPTGIPGLDPPTIGIGCDQTGGSSGGPWIVDFSGFAGANNFLNGNNSYKYTGPNPPENLKMWGPYFSDGAINLRDSARVVIVP